MALATEPVSPRIVLNESYGSDGALVRVELRRDGSAEGLVLAYEGKTCELDVAVVFAVFAKLGKEMDPDVAPNGSVLELGEGSRLCALRHLARFDVIARDYVVLDRVGRPPVVELATSVSAALVHLAEAALRRDTHT